MLIANNNNYELYFVVGFVSFVTVSLKNNDLVIDVEVSDSSLFRKTLRFGMAVDGHQQV